MQYVTIASDDMTTLKSALIQQKRMLKADIDCEVGIFIPLSKIESVLDEHLPPEKIREISGGEVVMMDARCQS